MTEQDEQQQNLHLNFYNLKKEIKINDLEENKEDNLIYIEENANLQIGTGTRVIIYLLLMFQIQIWECGIILSKYIYKQNEDLEIIIKDSIILELGCGTGFCSIYCSKLQPQYIIATDLELIQSFTEKNISLNNEQNKISFASLDWDKFNDSSQQLQKLKEIMIEKQIKNFDYIIASDVIFNQSQLISFTQVKYIFYKLINFLQTLQNIYEFLIQFQDGNSIKVLPTTLLCYKSRNYEIDTQLVNIFEQLGFYGDQVENELFDNSYINKDIDIFKLTYKNYIKLQ